MKPTIAKLWVEALRSGKFKQARGSLTKCNLDRSNMRHCCLGVLTELAIEHGIDVGARTMTKKKIGAPYNYINYGADSSNLPHVVRKCAGMETTYGLINPNENLATKNDNGCSFKQIADIIEKNVQVL